MQMGLKGALWQKYVSNHVDGNKVCSALLKIFNSQNFSHRFGVPKKANSHI